MSATKVLLALAALGVSTVTAQCSASTITVAAPAEATINCRTVEGSIVFEDNDDMTGDIILEGPQSIKGDLIVNGTKNIVSLSSTSVGNIGGKFQLQGLEKCSRVDFSALQTVGEIEWITLPALESLDFGRDGVTTVKKVTISDTFLSSLDGLNMVSVGSFNINNNNRLATWETQMTNITDKIEISENAPNLQVAFPSLTWANSIEVRGIQSLSVPLLSFVNESMTFDDNNLMESFIAPNLTETGGDLVFINNEVLNNISFPVLERTGAITIRNNQELLEINGFPELTQVDGAVELRGNYTEASLPKLDDVKGAFTALSTEEIQSTCDTFQKLGNKVQGDFECAGSVSNANEGGDSSDSDKDDAGAFLAVDKSLMIVAALAGLYQLL